MFTQTGQTEETEESEAEESNLISQLILFTKLNNIHAW